MRHKFLCLDLLYQERISSGFLFLTIHQNIEQKLSSSQLKETKTTKLPRISGKNYLPNEFLSEHDQNTARKNETDARQTNKNLHSMICQVT